MPEKVRRIHIIWGNIILGILFVLFIFCKPTDNFYGVDGWVIMLADFDETSC
jgi:hypothetical protein